MLAALALAACASGLADDDLLAGAHVGTNAEFAGVASDLDDDTTRRLVGASRDLAVALVAGAEGSDVVVSPLGLQLALAVLREGATGPAAADLDAVAGLGGSQAVADLRARLDAWAGDVSAVERDEPPERPLLHVADAVMVQEGLEVGAEFLDAAARFHRAQVYATDFTTDEATRLGDAWVRRESGGLLGSAPLEPDPGTIVRLLDVVVLAASWRTQFVPEATSDAPFVRGDGSSVEVPTMHALETLTYAAGDGWQAVELPYTEAFSMRVVVADGGGPVDATTWAEADEGLDAGRRPTVSLAMPRWETSSVSLVVPLLADMGLDSLLAPGGLDGVVPGAFVGGAAQAGTITVAERGTVAAVVTDTAIAGSAPPEPDVVLRLDRPFEYRVVEDATGLVLVAGRLADPS